MSHTLRWTLSNGQRSIGDNMEKVESCVGCNVIIQPLRKTVWWYLKKLVSAGSVGEMIELFFVCLFCTTGV
jgi:hypothetical protein